MPTSSELAGVAQELGEAQRVQKSRGSPSGVVRGHENSEELQNAGTDSTLLLAVGSVAAMHGTNLPASRDDQMAGNAETVATADDVTAAIATAAAEFSSLTGERGTVEGGASEEECTAPASAAGREEEQGGEGEEGRQAPPATTASAAEPQSGESRNEIDAAISVSTAGAAGVKMVLPSSIFNLLAIACQREETDGVGVGAEPSGGGSAGDKRTIIAPGAAGAESVRRWPNKRCRSGGAEGNVTKAFKSPWWEAWEKDFVAEGQDIAADEEAYKRSLKIIESRAHQERRDNEDFARNENHRRENQPVRRRTQ